MVWYDSDYGYKKKITIDHTLVSGDETDFPVLISVTDNDLRDTGNSGHVAHSSGYDIIFTNSAEDTLLKHEIERYVNTSGLLVFWVKVNSLSSTGDTDIYIYYGKAGVGADPSTTDTWDGDFAGVWHMDGDDYANIDDSTANGNDATSGVGCTFEEAGKTGLCVFFDRSSNAKIVVPHHVSLSPADMTAEFWVNPDLRATKQPTIGKFDYSPRDGYRMVFDENNTFQVTWNDGGAAVERASDAYPGFDGWYYNAIANGDGVNDGYIYVNDNKDPDTGTTDSLGVATEDLWFGRRTHYDDHSLEGHMDEIRISKVRRSDNWILTTYKTQNDPAGFMAWGIEETEGAGLTHTPSDSVSIADSIIFKHEIPLSDSLSISDGILLRRLLALNDSLSLSDSPTFKRLLELTDSISVSDDALFKHGINISDSVSTADFILTFRHEVALDDSIAIDDSVSLFLFSIELLQVNLFDSVSISDSASFKRLLALADTIGINDEILIKHIFNFSESIAISDDALFKHSVNLTDSVVADDSVLVLLFEGFLIATIIDSVGIDDNIAFKHELNISDMLSVADSTTFKRLLELSETISIGDSVRPDTLFQLIGSSYTVNLPMPEYGGESGSINNELKLFSFWLEDRSTETIGINTEPIIIGGTIHIFSDDTETEMASITTKFLNIHTMMDNHEEIEVTGLGACFDAVYVIKDFNCGTVRGSPYAYTWQLAFEYVGII